MPIYEYRCSDCGHRLEALQPLADAPLLVCPASGTESLIKLISAAGFELKGRGWYATDFKHSGSKPADKSSAKSESASEGSSGGDKGEGAAASAPSGEQKADAKPAAPAASSESKSPAADSKPSTTTTPAKPAAPGS